MFSRLTAVAAGISSLTQNVVAYPSAPGVCSDDISKVSMSSRYQKFPGKAGGNPGQTFQISSQSGDWSGKSKVDVSVVAPGNENMKGFVVVAEDMQGNRVGSFDEIPNIAKQPSACSTPEGSIGHSRRIMVNRLDLQWNPPAEGVGPVTFKGIVLSGFNAFWNPEELELPETKPQKTKTAKGGKKKKGKKTKKAGKKKQRKKKKKTRGME